MIEPIDEEDMTPEQLAAFERAKKKQPSEQVRDQARGIVEAVNQDRFALTTFVPAKSHNVYYVVSTIVEGELTPLAVIPENMEIGTWIKMIDKLISQHGSADSDPEFAGIKH